MEEYIIKFPFGQNTKDLIRYTNKGYVSVHLMDKNPLS
ncbi:lipocalin-like domain-containing protein [Shewanella sp. 202IG2-18]|nr:lipocalin-like domain-containing protein [Parashewanella hymeniacidonis]